MRRGIEVRVNELIDKLEKKSKTTDQTDPLVHYSTCRELVLATINEIKKIQTTVEPANEELQIRINKTYIVPLYSKQRLFEKRYQLECKKKFCTAATQIAFITAELATINTYLDTQLDFSQYYDSGQNTKDHIYFLNEEGNLLLSNLLFNRQYAKILLHELEFLTTNDSAESTTLTPPSHKDNIAFTGTKSELMQLALALYAAGNTFVNGKPATVKWFIKMLSEMFGCELKNGVVLASQNRYKLEGGNTYPAKLHKLLMEYNEDLQNGKKPHKRIRKGKSDPPPHLS